MAFSQILCADARRIPLADESVQCVVTSPPYWGLRKYAGEQELDWNEWRGAYGLEPTVEMYVQHTVEILREIRRVLRKDGVCFLNLGDSYAASGGGAHKDWHKNDGISKSARRGGVSHVSSNMNPNQSLAGKRAPACGSDDREFLDWLDSGCACSCHDDERQAVSFHGIAHTDLQREQGVLPSSPKDRDSELSGCEEDTADGAALGVLASSKPAFAQSSQESHVVRFCSDCLSFHRSASSASLSGTSYHIPKPKDLCLIPQRVALAAQADGWWVRSDIIWHKPNPMPESCKDRPTDAYEHILMLTKSAKYYWDADAVSEPAMEKHASRYKYTFSGSSGGGAQNEQMPKGYTLNPEGKREFNGKRNLRNVWQFATQPYKGTHFATFPMELPRRCIKGGTRPGDLVLDPFGGSGTTGVVARELGRSVILIDLAYHDLARERLARSIR